MMIEVALFCIDNKYYRIINSRYGKIQFRCSIFGLKKQRIKMNIIKAFVSSLAFNRKPNKEKGEYEAITKALKRGAVEITPYQLAEYLCLGHSVSPVYPNKDIAGRSEMSFICFDFDHMKMDMSEHLKKVVDTPTIAYHTFSHQPNDLRYRFIYVFTEPISGSDFEKYQNLLMKRNGIKKEGDNNVDSNALTINNLFNGTFHPVLYNGILYDHHIVPIALEKPTVITRKTANPPSLQSLTKTFKEKSKKTTNSPNFVSSFTSLITDSSEDNTVVKYTENDISVLTSVGVTKDCANYYYSHTWSDFLSNYTPSKPVKYESDYIQVEGDCYAVAPPDEDYYCLKRNMKYERIEEGGRSYTKVTPFKCQDGHGRGRRLYLDILALRALNITASPDELLYYTVQEYVTFFNNTNGDGKTKKYNNRTFAQQFSKGMQGDYTKLSNPPKHSSIHITSGNVNKRKEAPRAVAKERHKKILSLYEPNLDMESNIAYIQDVLGIHLTKPTLQKILRKASNKPPQPTHKDRVEIFKCLYDPSKTDAENLTTMQDNISISRATYYRLKKSLLQ